MGLFEHLINKVKSKYYKDLSNEEKIKPLVIWGNVDDFLNEYYKIPNINLSDKKEHLNIKNTMRHIVGASILAQEYPFDKAQEILDIKEKGDYWREKTGFGYKPKFSEKYYMDNLIDKENNNIGLNFGKNNPNAALKEIMDFAYSHATDKTKVNPYNYFDFLE